MINLIKSFTELEGTFWRNIRSEYDRQYSAIENNRLGQDADAK